MQETAMAPMKGFLLKSDLFTSCLTSIKSSVGVENSSISWSVTLTHSICCPSCSIELSNSISALNEGLGFMHYQPANTSNGECFFSTTALNILENTWLWSFENCKIGEKNWGYWLLLIILKYPLNIFFLNTYLLLTCCIEATPQTSVQLQTPPSPQCCVYAMSPAINKLQF